MTTHETVLTLAERVDRALRDIPDFPEPGVVFKDLTPVLADGVLLGDVVRDMAQRYAGRVDVVAGVEARGFIFGAAVAHELGIGFVPVRKAGKLPGATVSLSYELEYGSATIEVHEDGFEPGARVLVVDDVLATGGTAEASCRLVEQVGATVVAFEVLVELTFLGGRDRLAGREVHTSVVVTGD
ncbi:adenine phosphoribosyltransferase [Phycicoccus ginsengisoli]